MDKGRIIAEGTSRELKSYLSQGALEFFFRDHESMEAAASLLKDYKTSFVPEEYKLTVFTDGKGDTLAGICSMLYQNHVKIQDFTPLTPRLEDVFLSMIDGKENDRNEV